MTVNPGESSESEDWVPAFPSQRPPFRPGNTISVGNRGPMTHGAYSARRTEPIARQLVKDLRAEPEFDWLRAPRFKETLWLYCRTVAQTQVLDDWMADKPMELLTDSVGGKTSPLELSRQLTRRTTTLAERLGIVPSVSDEVAAEIAAARRTLAKRAAKADLQADLKTSLRAQQDGG
jgi:hypothetical protein